MSDFLSTAEAAARLGVPKRNLQRACLTYYESDGADGFPCVRVGNPYRIPASALEVGGPGASSDRVVEELQERVRKLECVVVATIETLAQMETTLRRLERSALATHEGTLTSDLITAAAVELGAAGRGSR